MTEPILVSIPADRVLAMVHKLERITMLTSDEPQSLAQSVLMELCEWGGDFPVEASRP